MSSNKTITHCLGGRLLPLPPSTDPAEVINQAEAALILHTSELQRKALILASVRLLSLADLAALAVDLADRMQRAGSPVPRFLDLRAESAEWASFANLAELRAYCGACLRALPEADVAKLAVALDRRAAA